MDAPEVQPAGANDDSSSMDVMAWEHQTRHRRRSLAKKRAGSLTLEVKALSELVIAVDNELDAAKLERNASSAHTQLNDDTARSPVDQERDSLSAENIEKLMALAQAQSLSELPGGARGDALDDGGARGIRSLAHDGRGRRARPRKSSLGERGEEETELRNLRTKQGNRMFLSHPEMKTAHEPLIDAECEEAPSKKYDGENEAEGRQSESMILVRTVEQQHHLIRSLQAQVSNLERAHHKALALHQAEKSAWQDREAQMRLTNSALCIELEGFQRTSFGARSSCASSAPEDENV